MSNQIITCPLTWSTVGGFSADSLVDRFPTRISFNSSIPLCYHSKFHFNVGECASSGSIYKQSIQSNSEHTSSTYSHLIFSQYPRTVDYYVFANDDKYFYSASNFWFHDTLLYSDFYSHLPDPSYLPIKQVSYDISDPEKSIVVFSRKQFGHFLFDDLLPCIASLQHRDNCFNQVILMYSQDWQCSLSRTLLSIFSPSIKLQCIKLPSYSCQISFTGYSVLPVYPEILYQIKALFDSRICSEKYGGLYFHRGLYQGSNRVSNYQELVNILPDSFSLFVPHEYSFSDLFQRIFTASCIISEPGTLPLLAYLSGASTDIEVIYSKRCLSDCPPKYFYSGWRYHLPWLESVRPVWMEPSDIQPNPFSDVGLVPPMFISSFFNDR